MFGHKCFTARVEVIHKNHTVVSERLAREYLSQRDEVAVRHLLPLVNETHALGVDETVSMDPPQTHVLACLYVYCLINCCHVSESGGFMQGRSWRWFQGA